MELLRRNPDDVWCEFHRTNTFVTAKTETFWNSVRGATLANESFFARRWPSCKSADPSRKVIVAPRLAEQWKAFEADALIDALFALRDARDVDAERLATKGKNLVSLVDEAKTEASLLHRPHDSPCFGGFQGRPATFPFAATAMPGHPLLALFDYDVYDDKAAHERTAELAVEEGWFLKNARVSKSFHRNDTGGSAARVSFYVNASLVRRLLVDGESCPYEWLLTTCAYRVHSFPGVNAFPEVHRPAFRSGTVRAECGTATRLYAHQEDARDWMTDVESRSGKPFAFRNPSVGVWLDEETGVLVDYRDLRLRANEESETSDRSHAKDDGTVRITARGGILADEMGLGKTLVVLSLVSSDRREGSEPSREDDRVPGEAAKPGEFPDPRSVRPVSSRAGEIGGGSTNERRLELCLSENVVRTNATLVVCPSHLVSQWSQEVRKHLGAATGDGGDVITIATRPQWQAFTYRDFLSATLVVVSSSLLQNPAFQVGGFWSELAPTYRVDLDSEDSASSSSSSSDGSKKRKRAADARKASLEAAKTANASVHRPIDSDRVAKTRTAKPPKKTTFPPPGECVWRNAFSIDFGEKSRGFQEGHLRAVVSALKSFRSRLGRARRSSDPSRWEAITASLLRTRSPNLIHFGWRRLILDEAHELANFPQAFRFASLLVSERRWLVTGTPEILTLRGSAAWANVLEFLRVVATDAASGGPPHEPCRESGSEDSRAVSKAVHGAVLQELFWRNTKSSALDYESLSTTNSSSGTTPLSEGAFGSVCFEIVPVELLPVEIAVYRQASIEGAGPSRLLQICCHPQVSTQERNVVGAAELSLEEIRKTLVTHHSGVVVARRKQLVSQQKTLDLTVRVLATTQEMLDSKLEEETANDEGLFRRTELDLLRKAVAEHANSAQVLRSAIVLAETTLRQTESTLRFLQTIDSDREFECPICFGDVPGQDSARAILKSCGHTACVACLRNAFCYQKKCPICRHALDGSNADGAFWVVACQTPAGDGKEPVSESDGAYESLARKTGSKMARIILFLQTLRRQSTPEFPQRAIVFSQFDAMLQKIGDTMKAHGVVTVHARGNVHSRNAAVRKFKTDPNVSAILLSTEHSASGTNLQEATHVLFVEALLGDARTVRATRLQAIGRAHRLGQTRPVRVVHFVAQNTVEQEIHFKNAPET